MKRCHACCELFDCLPVLACMPLAGWHSYRS
jgi:hypothetical protein